MTLFGSDKEISGASAVSSIFFFGGGGAGWLFDKLGEDKNLCAAGKFGGRGGMGYTVIPLQIGPGVKAQKIFGYIAF